jgi:hypothetical protein
MKLSIRLLFINILTLVALISFNHQNYRLVSKIKATAATTTERESSSYEDTDNLNILFGNFTQDLIATLAPDSPDFIVDEFTNVPRTYSSNPTLNHLYLAHSPPVFA